jgi:high-affinity iron transporter
MTEPSPLRRQWVATAIAAAVSVGLVATANLSVQLSPTPSDGSDTPSTTVSITDKACGAKLANQSTGPATFDIRNGASWPTEVYLVKQPDMGTLFRTVVLGPGSTVVQNAVLGPGDYAFQCLQSGQLRTTSATFTATGNVPPKATPAVRQASTGELQQSNSLYLKHASSTLSALAPQLRALTGALVAGDREAARSSWLAARQTWAGLGAAYGSFGDAGDAIEGVRNPALPPENDKDFTGLARIEFGLFNGEKPQELAPVGHQLEADVSALASSLPTLALVPGSLPLRAHEILEDTLRDTLSGHNDQGASMAFAITSADVAATRSTVADLATPLESRRPGLVSTINERLDAVDSSLAPLHHDDRWVTMGQASQSQRQSVNGAVSAALEVLADVPQLLALPQGSE